MEIIQHGSGTRAFLHNVIYIPDPRIIAANAASGTKINKLVFIPIKKIQFRIIKLSQFYSIVIVKVPLVFGSCNNATSSRGNRSDALSHFTAKVLGHIKSLFLITISSE